MVAVATLYYRTGRGTGGTGLTLAGPEGAAYLQAMARFLLSLKLCAAVMLLLATACAGRAPEPVPRVTATRPPGADVVVVRVSHLVAADEITSIRLVGPDARSYAPAARSTHLGRAAGVRQPKVGVQVEGGSASGIDPGVAIALPLLDWSWLFGGGDDDRRSVTARIPLPEGYESNPEAWRVEVTLDRTGRRPETRTLPAPR